MIVGSIFIKDIVQDRMNNELNIEFEKAYSSVLSRLDNQLDRLLQVIQSTQGLYYQTPQVVRDYFELNGAVPVQSFNSIMLMCYAPKVLKKDYGAFQYDALCQGYNRYDLYPTKPSDV